MTLFVKRKIDGQVFPVFKYIATDDGEYHIWCREWEGHHRIGADCEWNTPPAPIFKEELRKNKRLESVPEELNIPLSSATEGVEERRKIADDAWTAAANYFTEMTDYPYGRRGGYKTPDKETYLKTIK